MFKIKDLFKIRHENFNTFYANSPNITYQYQYYIIDNFISWNIVNMIIMVYGENFFINRIHILASNKLFLEL